MTSLPPPEGTDETAEKVTADPPIQGILKLWLWMKLLVLMGTGLVLLVMIWNAVHMLERLQRSGERYDTLLWKLEQLNEHSTMAPVAGSTVRAESAGE